MRMIFVMRSARIFVKHMIDLSEVSHELHILLLLRLCQIDNVDRVEVAVLALVLFLFLVMSKEKRASLIFLNSGRYTSVQNVHFVLCDACFVTELILSLGS